MLVIISMEISTCMLATVASLKNDSVFPDASKNKILINESCFAPPK